MTAVLTGLTSLASTPQPMRPHLAELAQDAFFVVKDRDLHA